MQSIESKIYKDMVCDKYIFFHKQHILFLFNSKKLVSIKESIYNKFKDTNFQTNSLEINDLLFEYTSKKLLKKPPNRYTLPENIIKPFLEQHKVFKINGYDDDDDDDDDDDKDYIDKFVWDNNNINSTYDEISETYQAVYHLDDDIKKLYNIYKQKLFNILHKEPDNQYYYEKCDFLFELNEKTIYKFNKQKFMLNKKLFSEWGVLSGASIIRILEY
jgi:hypothetical protein